MSKSARSLSLLLLPSVAFAHPGGEAGGFVHGLVHLFGDQGVVLSVLLLGVLAAAAARFFRRWHRA